MSKARPRPTLPKGAVFEDLSEGLYRWRLPEDQWLYCVGKKTYRPLCQEQKHGLLVYKLRMRDMFHLNRILNRLDYKGRFRYAEKTAHYTERYPYPKIEYFPGMIISSEGRVMNGAWSEREQRRKIRGFLKVYLRMLKVYINYRSRYPLPDEEADCLYCRGERKCCTTMYSNLNHDYLHLSRYELEGSLLWNALHEMGYGDGGKLKILGYDGPPQAEVLCEAVKKYFSSRGGV